MGASFCKSHPENTDFCQLIQSTHNRGIAHSIDIDGAFRNAWNMEIKSENKIKVNMVTMEEEIDIKSNSMESVSSVLSTHPLIYIWTILFASCIMVFSFFMYYR